MIEKIWSLITFRNVGILKCLIAFSGTVILLWEVALERAGRPEVDKKTRDTLLLILGLLAALSWFNLFKFHFGFYINTWDFYHNYIGAKYSKELGRSRLYQCTVVADMEQGFTYRNDERKIRNPNTNLLEKSDAALAHPGECKSHFSQNRWDAFKQDLAWLRNRVTIADWQDFQEDLGYNSTPVWGILGTLLSNTGPITLTQSFLLALIDPILLIIMWIFIYRTFGWRVMCVGLLFWGANFLTWFFSIGGSFLRQDWLVLLIIGICLLRREKTVWAGILITYSALLRFFPACVIIALVIKAVYKMVRERKFTLSAQHKRFFAGCLIGFIVLVTASTVIAGGVGVWSEFTTKIKTHMNTPLTNNIGLKAILSYDPKSTLGLMINTSLVDPSGPWMEKHREIFRHRLPIYIIVVLAFLILLTRAVKDEEDWVVATLGLGLIPVLTSPSSYYSCFLIGFAFLWNKNKSYGAGLVAISAISCVVQRIFFLYEEIYGSMAFVILTYIIWVTWSVGRTGPSHTARASFKPASDKS